MINKKNRSGESRIMNSGLKATIIRYSNAHDFDVEFENGMRVNASNYYNFTKGKIRAPMCVEKHGEYSTIINYNTNPWTVFKISNEDVERVVSVGFWSFGSGNSRKYIRHGSANLLLHRFLLDAACGFDVDHINGDTSDNRRSNLRICTHGENCKNVQVKERGFKGCYWHSQRKKWAAQIVSNGTHYFLGLFDCIEDATLAYDHAATELHGEFSNINSSRNAA